MKMTNSISIRMFEILRSHVKRDGTMISYHNSSEYHDPLIGSHT